MEAFLEDMGEHSVRLALRTRMRFPMPFGEYHAAMWLARRNYERRVIAARQAREAGRALHRGSEFAAGAAMVALFALAFDALLG